MSQTQRIALLIGQDMSFCRDVFRGIRAYGLDQRSWVFQNGPPELSVVKAFRHWKPHGFIAQLVTPELAREVLRLRKPVVDISCTIANLHVPLVDVDHKAVGRLAAEHFLERGYRHFGFFGSTWAHYSKLREASFQLRLIEAGCTMEPCYVEYLLRVPALVEWRHSADRVHRWMRDLPKPAGILAANDVAARQLADICRQLGLRVPDEVSLLGVDNDDLECGLASPPLSSVALPARQVGHDAARLLDLLIQGKPAPREPRLLPPLGVVTRQSTDARAVRDPVVIAAIDFIRGHAAEAIHVERIAAHVVQSRRMLEYKFRDQLGHTILDEIRRVRVGRVKELLAGTDWSMPAIARRAGFSSPQRMAIVFGQLTGQTPSAYRRQAQVQDIA